MQQDLRMANILLAAGAAKAMYRWQMSSSGTVHNDLLRPSL
jgi:hypothetical protein